MRQVHDYQHTFLLNQDHLYCCIAIYCRFCIHIDRTFVSFVHYVRNVYLDVLLEYEKGGSTGERLYDFLKHFINHNKDKLIIMDNAPVIKNKAERI